MRIHRLRDAALEIFHALADPRVETAAIGLLGFGCLALKRWRTGIALVALACAWLWLCATPAFARALQVELASRYPAQPAAAYPQVDAIVGLGGDSPPRGLADWNADARPAQSTTLGFVLALYRAHKAPRIALTSSNATPAAVAALIRQGVPAQAIAAYPVSADTHDDAVVAAQALHAWNAHRILLVTFGAHMPRSAAVFEKQGFEVIAAPRLPPARHYRNGEAWWPHHWVFYASACALHEHLGLFYYRLRGWASW